jgi:hypothetical protein
MSTSRRFLLVLILAFAALSVAMPALATDEPEEPAEVAETPVQEGDAPEPALPIEPEEPSEPVPEWTFRFLVPTAMLLGAVVVIGTIIAYFVKVTRARYRVVE